jgi:hypothetical protein
MRGMLEASGGANLRHISTCINRSGTWLIWRAVRQLDECAA